MARSALKIGVRDLADMASVTTATITRYENERGGLNATTRDKIATALELAGVIFVADGRGEGVIKMKPEYKERLEREERS
jgi:transcriptional regulator with XRE-family HTH domain